MKEGQKSRNKPPGPKTLSQAVSAVLGQLRRMTSHHCDLGVFPAGAAAAAAHYPRQRSASQHSRGARGATSMRLQRRWASAASTVDFPS